mgnify:CR=1 FL=1
MSNTENFECEYIYHVYTHANGKDLIFREEENYRYFLNKLIKYIIPIAEIYAYCLMPNHFHLLLRFKKIGEILNIDEHKYLMKQFSNLLNSYAKAYNKRYNRKGSLFLDYLKRKKVSDEKYLVKLLHYIHNNPVKDKTVSAPEDYYFSSARNYSSLENDLEVVVIDLI